MHGSRAQRPEGKTSAPQRSRNPLSPAGRGQGEGAHAAGKPQRSHPRRRTASPRLPRKHRPLSCVLSPMGRGGYGGFGQFGLSTRQAHAMPRPSPQRRASKPTPAVIPSPLRGEGRERGRTPRESPNEATHDAEQLRLAFPASTGPSPVSSPQWGEEVTASSDFRAYRRASSHRQNPPPRVLTRLYGALRYRVSHCANRRAPVTIRFDR